MSTYKIGDRVRFNGVNADAPERKASGVTGKDGLWTELVPGAVGTVTDVVPDDDEGKGRLFINFDEYPMPGDMDLISTLLGMPTGWPILAVEVEPVERAA